MKISLKWLNDYIEIKEFLAQPAELVRLLTNAGLEVEAMHEPAKDFQNVVVARILEKNAHPNSDRLSLCKVDTGDDGIKQIICGALNHKAGDMVVASLPGAVLPGGLAIKVSKIRGMESQGMLC